MSATDFDNLTNRLGHKLFKSDTSMRAAISVKERRAVTLRYLASGKHSMTLNISLFAFISPIRIHIDSR